MGPLSLSYPPAAGVASRTLAWAPPRELSCGVVHVRFPALSPLDNASRSTSLANYRALAVPLASHLLYLYLQQPNDRKLQKP